MNSYVLSMMNKQEFVEYYWQKKPLVIRQAFQNFVDPIDQHELAGLAQEADIDSRIITNHQSRWTVSHGPFEDFSPHCVGAWTLLVQAVDCYSEQAKALLDSFDFIPKWRVDDLMVSFSTAGAGVGPHLDQYDVFIVQGTGSRRWQVGEKKDYKTIVPTKDLKQTEPFEPIIDEVLLPGDMIYIPPGFPHNGVALEECLNYSIGFRAPTQRELLCALADYAQDFELFETRYSDPNLQLRDNQFEINLHEKQQFKELLLQMINSSQFDDFIGHFLSEPVSSGEYDAEFEENYSTETVANMLAEGTQFVAQSDAQIVQSKVKLGDKYQYVTWINQHKLIVNDRDIDDFNEMLTAPLLDKNQKIYHQNGLFFVQTLSRLISTGGFIPV
ncbi:cupin domain-containing protein [Aliiglaciecola litoralis]|uniref:Cupin domain-containing protein n=1 Tax=Aliiglaciecola litoralis TaxID=582857 RepID=A0ABP3WMW0_9ALTE